MPPRAIAETVQCNENGRAVRVKVRAATSGAIKTRSGEHLKLQLMKIAHLAVQVPHQLSIAPSFGSTLCKGGHDASSSVS